MTKSTIVSSFFGKCSSTRKKYPTKMAPQISRSSPNGLRKANDSKQSKTSKKSRKNKGEKEEEIGSINGKSKPIDLDINLKQKKERTNNELKLSTPHSQIVNGISPALSEKSKASQKSNKNAKSSPSKLHPSVISDDAKHAPACKRSAKNSSTAGTLSEQHHRNSRSQSAEKRKRSYSRSVSPQERARDRSNDRHSSSRRSVHRSDWSPPSRSLSRSRSPSIRRRKGSPSHLDRRRITSARKRPVPYYRPSPSSDRSGSWSSYSRYSRSKSRSSFGASPSPATLHRLRCSRHGHAAFNSLDLTQ